MKTVIRLSILVLGFVTVITPSHRAGTINAETSITELPTGRPISSALNPDGSIKRGISGSFDPQGFRMHTGPDGAPRFISESAPPRTLVPAGACHDDWDDRFTINGADTAVYAMAVDSEGNVYIGGHLEAVGDVVVNKVAKWNGSSWSPLGTGIVSGSVEVIATSGTDVYVGGFFYEVGGVGVSNIAKWDGSTW